MPAVDFEVLASDLVPDVEDIQVGEAIGTEGATVLVMFKLRGSPVVHAVPIRDVDGMVAALRASQKAVRLSGKAVRP